MQQLIVERDGEPLLVFRGEPLARIREAAALGDPNLWELRLYRTAERGYVLAASFHVLAGGNRRLNTAWSFHALDDFKDFLELDAGVAQGLMAKLLAKAALKDRDLSPFAPNPEEPSLSERAHA